MAYPNSSVLAGLLGGGAGAPAGPPAPDQGAPMGPPPGHPPMISVGGNAGPDPDAQGDRDAVKLVKQAVDLLRQAEAADTDASEEATIATCIANLKKIAMGRQKEKESAIGMSPAVKMAARANGAY